MEEQSSMTMVNCIIRSIDGGVVFEHDRENEYDRNGCLIPFGLYRREQISVWVFVGNLPDALPTGNDEGKPETEYPSIALATDTADQTATAITASDEAQAEDISTATEVTADTSIDTAADV